MRVGSTQTADRHQTVADMDHQSERQQSAQVALHEAQQISHGHTHQPEDDQHGAQCFKGNEWIRDQAG